MSEQSKLTAISQPQNPSTRPSKSKKQPPGSTTAPMPDIGQLTRLIETLRELGVRSFRQGDLHLELSPVTPPQIKASVEEPVIAGQPLVIPATQELSDEDLLFYSSDIYEFEKKNSP